jgi:phospholipase D1/2
VTATLEGSELRERAPWVRLTMVAATLVTFAAAWRYTPLSALTSADLISHWAEEFASRPWAPFALLATYTPASIVLFPRPLLTLFAVVAFGPWLGFTYAFGGILLAAFATYGLGAKLDYAKVRRIAGRRLNQLVDVLHRRGFLAMAAVRLVPVAPFAVVNIVAGAVRIRLRHFMGGSAIGILPGTFVATVFGDQLAAGLRDPRSINLWLICGACLVLFAGTWAVRRWLFHTEPHADVRSRHQA